MCEFDIKSMVKKKRLNLSGMNLTVIPAKEIALYNVTHLNMSNNNITSVDNIFELLPNLTKLDLSNNQIQKIPSDIGSLKNLVFLSLANNRISVLPNSMSDLYKLKYLSLNNNPLKPWLKKAIGPSETRIQCQSAAANALHYFQCDYQIIDKPRTNYRSEEYKKIRDSLLKHFQNEKLIEKTMGNKKQLGETVGTVSKGSRIYIKIMLYIRKLILIAITSLLLVYYVKEAYIMTKHLPIWSIIIPATSALDQHVGVMIENNLLIWIFGGFNGTILYSGTK